MCISYETVVFILLSQSCFCNIKINISKQFVYDLLINHIKLDFILSHLLHQPYETLMQWLDDNSLKNQSGRMITIIIKNERVQRYVIYKYENQPLAITKM